MAAQRVVLYTFFFSPLFERTMNLGRVRSPYSVVSIEIASKIKDSYFFVSGGGGGGFY